MYPFTRSHPVLPLSPFSICNGPRHPLYSAYVLDSPLKQPLSRSSVVFSLVLNPQLHTPSISSPNHQHLFAAHAHTNAACSAAIECVYGIRGRMTELLILSAYYADQGLCNDQVSVHLSDTDNNPELIPE